MDKELLIQYSDIKEEIKDLQRRIEKVDKYLSEPHQVTDTVKGTRWDGTIGNIKVTGYPVPEYYRKKVIREKYREMLKKKEIELLELTCRVEEYIETIDKSELRIMMRLYFIDSLSDVKVADHMNRMFPKRKIKYTDENVRKRRQRFFEKLENVAQCPA